MSLLGGSNLERIGVQVVAEGADEASAKVRAFAAAEEAAGAAGGRAASGVGHMTEAQRALSSETGKGASGMASFGKSVDAILGPLRMAANILPGLGMSGLVLAGFEGASYALGKLASALDITAFSAANYAKTASVLDRDTVASKLHVDDLSDAMLQYAKSLGRANAAQLTFREEQEALRKIASGEIKTMEATKDAAEKTAKDLALAKAAFAEFQRNPGDYTFQNYPAGTSETAVERTLSAQVERLKAADEELNRQQLGLLGQKGANPFLDQVQDFGAALVAKGKVAAGAAKDQLVGMGRQFDTSIQVAYAEWERNQKKLDDERRKAPKLQESSWSEFEMTDAETGPGAIERARMNRMIRMRKEIAAENEANKRAGFTPAWAGRIADSTSNFEAPDAVMQESIAKGMADAEALKSGASESAKRFGGAMTDVWRTQIPDAVSFGAQAIQSASGVIGQAFADMIIGGDKVKGGMGRVFGEFLAQQSAMLFGLATTATILGTAAEIMTVPIFGFTAGQAFGAAAVFAAGGAATAIAARALGAGHSPSSGRASSSTSGGASSPGSGAYQPGASQQQQAFSFSFYLDGAPVYDVMVRHDQERRSSGSLSRPILGRA